MATKLLVWRNYMKQLNDKFARINRLGISTINRLGELSIPQFLLATSVGLLLLAVANTLARFSLPGGYPLFWIALITIQVPVILILLNSSTSHQKRVIVLVLFTIAIYMIKVLHSPVRFTFSDEHTHWRNVIDVVNNGHLFSRNHVLPITPSFPSLSMITASYVLVSEQSYFISGIIVVGLSKVLLTLSLFLLYYECSESSYVASIATFIYFGSSNYVFFQSQFAYESLGLPLAVLALFLIKRRAKANQSTTLGYTIAVLIILGLIVVTHHLTSYATAAILTCVVILEMIMGYRKKGYFVSLNILILFVLTIIMWMIFVATPTLSYLAAPIVGGIREFISFITGHYEGRVLFDSDTGVSAPIWERLVGMAWAGLTVFSVPPALIVGWRKYRKDAVTLTLIGIGATYPPILALRFTTRSWEISNRSSSYMFIGLAFLLGIFVVEVLSTRWGRAVIVRVGALLGFMAMFVGGLTVGWSSWYRLPGEYLVAADTRSIETEGLEAAKWSNQYLGPFNRVYTDRINRLLWQTYGQQTMITKSGEGVAGYFMFNEYLTEENYTEFKEHVINMILVDIRLSTSLPWVGVYYEGGEPFTYAHREPISLSALQKFGTIPLINRVFDSGSLQLYDLQQLIFQE